MQITREDLLSLNNDDLITLLTELDVGLAEYVNLFVYGFVSAEYIEIPDDMIPERIYFMFIEDSGNSSKYIDDE